MSRNETKTKNKKTGYSCMEERWRGECNPIKHIARWVRNIKYCYQRIKYGYCDRDVWSIDWWFLNVVPNMLEDLKETTHGYPREFEEVTMESLGTDSQDEVDEARMQKWRDTLSEMIFLFREARDDTCTRKNPYEAEYDEVQEEFSKKYGFFGERLKTKEDLEEEEKIRTSRLYFPGDVPEYKDISEKYHNEWRKIMDYKAECKEKGLNLFNKWFWNLWD